MTVYDLNAGELWQYDEPFSEMEWTIANDLTKKYPGI